MAVGPRIQATAQERSGETVAPAVAVVGAFDIGAPAPPTLLTAELQSRLHSDESQGSHRPTCGASVLTINGERSHELAIFLPLQP